MPSWTELLSEFASKTTGGTTIIINEHCTKCGLHRAWTRYGSQRNPGQSDLVDYKYEPERGSD